MSITVKVHETEKIVTPAEPAKYSLTVDEDTRVGILNATFDGFKASNELYGKVVNAFQQVPGKPAVTKVEKTYTIEGLTGDDLSAINEAMYQVYVASLKPDAYIVQTFADFGYKHYNAGTFNPRYASKA
jgi:hypothetical protein